MIANLCDIRWAVDIFAALQQGVKVKIEHGGVFQAPTPDTILYDADRIYLLLAKHPAFIPLNLCLMLSERYRQCNEDGVTAGHQRSFSCYPIPIFALPLHSRE
ncbi:hypothetical protein RB195_021052 [Necator americanus]|uniref:Uncharacterized protein n=1 Tax=Necator americanus TaxID=51031 RepID=A0ABR1EA86_NECAM